MTYQEALEKAKHIPMIRPHWREWDQVMYAEPNGDPFLELSRSERTGFKPSTEDIAATDWRVAP